MLHRIIKKVIGKHWLKCIPMRFMLIAIIKFYKYLLALCLALTVVLSKLFKLSLEALQRHGAIIALISLSKILKCHPFIKGH